MKKILKKIMLFLGVLVILILLFFVFYFLRVRSAVKQMTPVETMQITDDVFAVRDTYVNMYLVRDGNHYIAVDAGNKRGVVKDEMKKLDIDPDKVKAVLLTHSDGDHAGAISLFKDAKIYLPRDEEQMINGETGRFLFVGNKIDAKEYELIDYTVFRIGDIKICPIATPGHTAGSTCYLVNDKYLFTGDALSLKGGKIDLFPKFINKNARRARKSMNEIEDIPGARYIFTAHYGYSNDYRSAVQGWKK